MSALRKYESRLVDTVLYGSVAGVLVFFYLPIFALIAFSFRAGKHLVLPFDGFSVKWYAALLADPDYLDAAFNSLLIAAVTAVISTIVGTAVVLAVLRLRFALRVPLAGLNIAPLVFPQLLLGIVLLLWFSLLGNWTGLSLGIPTVTIGHIVYITPFAAIVVGVRLTNIDPQLEDAARDCGASTWAVYRHITLPLLWPGIFAAAIFAFLLSWSNFYISFNLAGTAAVLPTYVYAGLAFDSSPLYPALATVSFIPSIFLVVLAERFRRKAAAASAGTGTGATKPFTVGSSSATTESLA